MEKVKIQYGGTDARGQVLQIGDEYLVVRTRSRLPIHRARITARSRAVLAPFEPVMDFHEAGVQVFKCRSKARRRRLRDEARRRLSRERDIHFSGRVLCYPRTRIPIVYTENLFVKFKDGETQKACRRRLEKERLIIKKRPGYAGNAFFVHAREGSGLDSFAIAARLLTDERVELCHPEVVRERRRRAAATQQWHLKKTKVGGRVISQHAHVVDAWRHSSPLKKSRLRLRSPDRPRHRLGGIDRGILRGVEEKRDETRAPWRWENLVRSRTSCG